MFSPFGPFPEIPAPADEDYPGVIRLKVDATDIARAIFHVRETIPVEASGPLTLLFPEWLPGFHSPRTPIALLAGLTFHAGDDRVSWRRDTTNVYAFHLDVPEGAEAIEAEFQFVSPTAPSQGRMVVTPAMLNLAWNNVVLYPAGRYVRRITVAPEITLPEGWEIACPLKVVARQGATIRFEPAPLDVVVDSPLMAGRHHRRIELDPAVNLNLFADRTEQLAATDEQVAPYKALVAQADTLFGARHFDRYEFLMALSDELDSEGIEHHRCCEIVSSADLYTAWETNAPDRAVVAHEYTHSWNGKFRRGADSWIAAYDQPIRSSLMWVYEGQTQYWGHVLAVRAGLWTADQAMGLLARTAATQAARAGRRWRAMCDTTRDPIIAGREPLPWQSWQRSEDYYSEGQLLWFDVDLRLRELTGDTASLDSFARDFFGKTADEGDTACTYEAEDVIRALEAVAPFDWEGLLIDRLGALASNALIDGLERGGYRLVFRRDPHPFQVQSDAAQKISNFAFSLGLIVGTNGTLQEVLWDSPAFAAELTAGAEITAVNGRAYSAGELERAVVGAEKGAAIELVVKRGQRYRTVQIDYRDGPRHPHLEPIDGARRRLDEIFAPI